MFNKFAITISLLLIISHSFAQNTVGSIPSEFNVANGTANYSIPIQVTPGRGGMQPELSLNYSSGGDNGVLGVGWNLGGLSAIHRCSQTIAQDGAVSGVNFDSNDRYCLDGQRLIPVNGANGGVGTEYRTEIDSYSQIISYGGYANNPSYWQVKTKAGQVLTFGGSGNASLALSKGIGAWSIREINDTTGNNPITYHYFIEQNTQYVNNITYSAGSVNFVYENNKDSYQRYFVGNDIVLSKRIQSIGVRHNNSLVNTYRIYYEASRSSQFSRIKEIDLCGVKSCLNKISFSWKDIKKFYSYATSRATYGNTSLFSNSLGQGINEDNYSTISFADVNGDGLADVCMRRDDLGISCGLNTGTRFSYSTASGTYGNSGLFAYSRGSSAINSDNYTTITYLDVNGDGMADVCMRRDDLGISCAISTGRGFSYSTASGTYGNTGMFSSRLGKGVSPDNYSTISFADVNGDGLPDVCMRRDDLGISCGLNTGAGFSYSTASRTYGNSGLFANSWGGSAIDSDNYTTINYLDVNGDGMADVCMRRDDLGISCAISTGRGFAYSTASGTYGNTGIFSNRLGNKGMSPDNHSTISFADVNGDGLPDVCMRRDDLGISCGLNTGVGFSYSTASGTYGNSSLFANSWGGSAIDNDNYTTISYPDVNGDRMADVCMRRDDLGISCAISTGRGFAYSTASGTYGNTGMFSNRLGNGVSQDNHSTISFADVNGDGLSDLCMRRDDLGISCGINSLTKAKNSGDILSSIKDSNTLTLIKYKPLNDPSVYTKGTGSKYPLHDLVSPQYVVSQVETSNGIGGKTAVDYQYEGLKIHLRGRGSYGYSKITESYPDTGKQKITTFDQRGFPYTGNVLGVVEKYHDQKVNEATNTMAASQKIAGVYQLHLQQSVQKSYELGDTHTPVTTVTTTHKNIDNYGNIGRVTVATNGNGQTFTKITTSSYSNNTANWFLGRLTDTTVTHRSPYGADETRRSTFTYDTSTGLLTTERIIGTKSGTNLTTTHYTYDAYGQKTRVRLTASGEQDRVTTNTYNSLGKITKSCNAVNQCETFTYTPQGWLAASTGPNGITTTWTYDSFGRKAREHRADGTWTSINRYFASSSRCGELANFAYSCTVTQSSGSQPAIIQHDALGREVRKIKQGFDERLVYSDVEYNHLSQVSRVSRDYYSGNHVYWATSEYDALGRVIRATEPGPHGSTNEITTEYNGLSTTVRSGPEQRAKTTVTNAIGQKVRIDEEEGAYTEYTYIAKEL